MHPRLSQSTRYIPRTFPILAHRSTARTIAFTTRIMASLVEDRNTRTIHTAACLIIGDEVLGGKVKSALVAYGMLMLTQNSRHWTKANSEPRLTQRAWQSFAFAQAWPLKGLKSLPMIQRKLLKLPSVCQIIMTSWLHREESVLRIHDDITYQSLAKAFSLPLTLHPETVEKMRRLSKPHPSATEFNWDVPSPALTAKLRMATLPIDSSRPISSQVIFPCDDLWVPVCCVNGNIHVLPGIPQLFQKLLNGLRPIISPRLEDPDGKGVLRIIIKTPLAESEVASYLADLAARVEGKGVKVGSYPRWSKSNNSVTLVGKDEEFLESLVEEVEKNVKGCRVKDESEDESDKEATKMNMFQT
ncbi:hypothetical protein Golomagni_03076 [Golovinomyces magnicellulatus]|nr:hypothetical protein Golomagni_03076 [Golovinomyces magnicellulatus]